MCVVRYAQITQNKKFAISLQYLKKEVNEKVDFLHASKHENLLQIDTMILILFICIYIYIYIYIYIRYNFPTGKVLELGFPKCI